MTSVRRVSACSQLFGSNYLKRATIRLLQKDANKYKQGESAEVLVKP